MAKELKGTKTEANLMAAFAGESQARNKYTYYASKAKKDGYEQIAALFQETADQEKEHAKVWFKLLHDGIGATMDNLVDAAGVAHHGRIEGLFHTVIVGVGDLGGHAVGAALEVQVQQDPVIQREVGAVVVLALHSAVGAGDLGSRQSLLSLSQFVIGEVCFVVLKEGLCRRAVVKN